MMQRRPPRRKPGMSRNRRLLLLLILVLLGVSIWLMTPNGSSVLGRGTEDLGLTLGLDLRGGSELIYQVKFSDNATADDKAQVMDAVVTTIERRVNKYGVVEPVVQQQGEERILIQLPGITNVDEAKSLIEQTAFLEFREVELNGSNVATLQDYLDDPSRVSFLGSSVSGSRIFYIYGGSQDPVAVLNLVDGVLTYTDKDGNAVDPATLGSEVSGAYSWMPATGTIDSAKKPLTGAYLTKAQREVHQNTTTGETTIGVGIQWNSEGADIFNQIAGRLYPSYSETSVDPRNLLGIVLDGQMISHPQIMQSSYENGSAEITGNFTLGEARTLAVELTSGQLVAPLIKPPLYEQNISATLGADFVHRALTAAVVGLLVVILFMVLYYRALGVVAGVALLIYAALVIAIFKLIPVTLTLAGIGGFVVSLGMAVDANVLIFERMKEELRAGSTVGAAAEAGFDRAWSAIRDSNITTFIACGVLYWLGSQIAESSQVKGFALTLFIGVAVSMFTAIVVTHSLVRLLVITGPGGRFLRPSVAEKTGS